MKMRVNVILSGVVSSLVVGAIGCSEQPKGDAGNTENTLSRKDAESVSETIVLIRDQAAVNKSQCKIGNSLVPELLSDCRSVGHSLSCLPEGKGKRVFISITKISSCYHVAEAGDNTVAGNQAGQVSASSASAPAQGGRLESNRHDRRWVEAEVPLIVADCYAQNCAPRAVTQHLNGKEKIYTLQACVGLFRADRDIYDSTRNLWLERKGQPKIAWDVQCTVQNRYEAGQTENPTPIEVPPRGAGPVAT